MKQLQDQHVLILGLGISGLSMARWCVRHGAVVTVADTRETPPSLAALRAECPQATFVAGAFDDALLARAAWNVIARSPGLPPRLAVGLVDEAVRAHGGVDIVVPNAGIARVVSFEDSTAEAFNTQFSVNLFGAAETARLFVPHIRKGGSIQFITTFLTQVGFPGLAIYSASKAALKSPSDLSRQATGVSTFRREGLTGRSRRSARSRCGAGMANC